MTTRFSKARVPTARQVPFSSTISSGLSHVTRSSGDNTLLIGNVPEKQLFANPPHQVPSLSGVPVVTSVTSYLATAPPNVGCPPEHQSAGRQCSRNSFTSLHYGAIPSQKDKIVHMDLCSFNRQMSLPRDTRHWPSIDNLFNRGASKRSFVDDPAIPQLSTETIRAQGYTSTCWAHAFAGMWYHEMLKIDPMASFPSRLWIISNTPNEGCAGGGSMTSAALMASQVGMIPEGDSVYDTLEPNVYMTTTQCEIANSNTVPGRPASGTLPAVPATPFRTVALHRKALLVKTAAVSQVPVLFSNWQPASDIDKVTAIYTSLAAGYPVSVYVAVSPGDSQNSYQDPNRLKYFGTHTKPVVNNALNVPVTYPNTPISILGPPGSDQHNILFTGFRVIAGVPCFLVKNSWCLEEFTTAGGNVCTWGNGGYAWLSTATAASWSEATTYAPAPNGGVSLPFGVPAGRIFRTGIDPLATGVIYPPIPPAVPKPPAVLPPIEPTPTYAPVVTPVVPVTPQPQPPVSVACVSGSYHRPGVSTDVTSIWNQTDEQRQADPYVYQCDGCGCCAVGAGKSRQFLGSCTVGGGQVCLPCPNGEQAGAEFAGAGLPDTQTTEGSSAVVTDEEVLVPYGTGISRHRITKRRW